MLHARFIRSFLLGSSAAAFLLSTPAIAQVSTLPGPAEPGRIEQQIKKPEQLPDTVESQVPEVPDQRQPDNADKVKFTLHGITIEGSSVYSEEELLPYYEDMLNQTVTLADMYELAQKITVKYRNDGYIMSTIVVPPQKVNGGKFRFKAIEGFINKVIIESGEEGEASLETGKIRKMLDKITQARPLTAEALERYLLLVNDLPGMDARAVVRPAENVPGAADLTIVLYKQRYDGFVQVDNRGTRFIGPVQIQAQGMVNGAAFDHDQIAFRPSTTAQPDELLFGELSYRTHLGDEGLYVEVIGAYTQSEPGFTLEPFDIESESLSADVRIAYPLIRSRQQNLLVYGTFSYNDAETDQLNARLSEDRTRAVRLGANFDIADRWGGVSGINAEISQGLDLFNSTEGKAQTSRALGEHKFSKLNAEIFRLQHLIDRFSMMVALKGQYSGDELLAREELGLGGADYGRGYDPSEITGDTGAAGLVEVRFNNELKGMPVVNGYEAYAFYDLGMVYNYDPGAGQKKRRTQASAGVGSRFYFDEEVSADLQVVKPMTRRVGTLGTKGDDLRFFFRLTKDF